VLRKRCHLKGGNKGPLQGTLEGGLLSSADGYDGIQRPGSAKDKSKPDKSIATERAMDETG
jgi:hypothetical protein